MCTKPSPAAPQRGWLTWGAHLGGTGRTPQHLRGAAGARLAKCKGAASERGGQPWGGTGRAEGAEKRLGVEAELEERAVGGGGIRDKGRRVRVGAGHMSQGREGRDGGVRAKGSGRGRGAEGCRESGQRGNGGLTPGCRLTCRENMAPSRGPFMVRERGRRSGCGVRLRVLAEAGGGQDTRGGVCSRAGRDGAGRGSRPRGSKLEVGS